MIYKSKMSTWLWAVLVGIIPLTTHHSPLTPSLLAGEQPLDSLMYHDPELPRAKIAYLYDKDPLPAWLVALRRPEADYQYRAALTIVLAHQNGQKGMEAAIEPLLETLGRPDQKDVVRLAVIRALIELDARQSASQLFEQAKPGNHDFRNLIEPALARWNFQPAKAVWLDRIRRPETSDGDLVLAIRGLAALKENQAISVLTDLLQSRQASWPIRLEAARALGDIKTSGLEEVARRLAADNKSSAVGVRQEAASLLRHHHGGEAIQILQSLARDSEPAVAVAALERLMELDPKLVLSFIDVVLASPDVKVRSMGVEAVYRVPTVDRIPLLAAKLDDPHPEVRTKSRQFLHDLGTKAGYHDPVIREALKVLDDSSWRGLEQATILLAELDHKPAAGRMAELLTFDRPEVFVAAAWGLRRLVVPETLPNALEHFESTIRLVQANQKSPKPQDLPLEAYDRQLSHLAQFMGRGHYQPAIPVFLLQVPRFRPRTVQSPVIGLESRAASIWALGWLYEGKQEPKLVTQLEERLNDGPKGMDPGDHQQVRRMSAIALARMKSMGSVPSLRRWHVHLATLEVLPFACGWAIQHLTGEDPTPPGTINFAAKTFQNWLQNIHEPNSAK